MTVIKKHGVLSAIMTGLKMIVRIAVIRMRCPGATLPPEAVHGVQLRWKSQPVRLSQIEFLSPTIFQNIVLEV